MKNKIVFLKGLPGSGKSTFANEFLQANPGALRLNKDDLRVELFPNKFQRKNEKQVIQTERNRARGAILSGNSIIVDNTHFNPIHERFYRQLAVELGADFELIEVNTPVFECVRRDNLRRLKGERYVGRDVIMNMAWVNNIYRSPNNCIVSDMDGTLADCNHRRGFVRNLNNDPNWKKDWGTFFALCGKDSLRTEVYDKIIKAKESGLDIILVSARPEHTRKTTENWLARHSVPHDRLIMRDNGDSRGDVVVKQEILDKYLDKSKITLVMDDRPKVIRMWRDNGLNVEDYGNGEEF